VLLTFLLLTPRPAEAGTLPKYTNLHTAVRALDTIIPEVQNAAQADQDQMLCLALNIYHEIRGGSSRDQWAVAYVTYNRTKRGVFRAPSLCAVVWAPGQFSWTRWSMRAQLPRDQSQWAECQRKAALMVGGEKMNDPTNGSTHFNSSLRNWGRGLVNRFRIGAHWFARLPGIN
jgi:spore germination cell wall hydrolase CwlJ-like protein